MSCGAFGCGRRTCGLRGGRGELVGDVTVLEVCPKMEGSVQDLIPEV